MAAAPRLLLLVPHDHQCMLCQRRGPTVPQIMTQNVEWRNKSISSNNLITVSYMRILEKSTSLPKFQAAFQTFGRLQEIRQVTEAIQSGSVSVVWITGGPGFGKTTVANKAAHELSRLDCERAVLFCSLRSTRSLSEAATLMALACSENQTQPPEDPQHWLLNWSKQKSSMVTLVLDNADEVLEDSVCRNEFLNLLENTRRLSRQNITFIITSRMAFRANSSQPKNVRLACLQVEDAKQILLSRVADLESRPKLSKVEKLAELCGFFPSCPSNCWLAALTL